MAIVYCQKCGASHTAGTLEKASEMRNFCSCKNGGHSSGAYYCSKCGNTCPTLAEKARCEASHK